ncbi:hypothetical protein ACQ4M3_28860 [Leptolyngbya sp. AN03gr2]|uniref:hypothetical protein n=1 Tax=unclassified Leptolyngbya TaxID=2650499 RepID=UPI003D31F794
MLLTIADLQNLQPPLRSSRFQSLQERLQFAIRQQQIGLPIQPLLESDSTLKSLVKQVQRSLPNTLQSGKQLKLHHPISARLVDQVYVQIEINVGFHQRIPKLFEWAIRDPELNWCDQIKLWATTQHYEADPNQVKLIVLALHPNRRVKKVMHCWDRSQHEMTRQALLAQLNAQPSSESAVSVSQSSIDLIDLDSIREVVL